MPRTTLNIEEPILKELKKLQKKRGKSLGSLVSELLSGALRLQGKAEERPPFAWKSQAMKALLDLADKEAVWSVLDEKHREKYGRIGEPDESGA